MGKLLMRFFTTVHAKIVKATGKLGGGTKDGSVLVLRHEGARSGRTRETPLMFINDHNGYVVCASMAGAPNHPGWYFNLKAKPYVQVTIDRTTLPVRARELADGERDAAWARFTALDDRWERYAAKTDRQLPLIALERV